MFAVWFSCAARAAIGIQLRPSGFGSLAEGVHDEPDQPAATKGYIGRVDLAIHNKKSTGSGEDVLAAFGGNGYSIYHRGA